MPYLMNRTRWFHQSVRVAGGLALVCVFALVSSAAQPVGASIFNTSRPIAPLSERLATDGTLNLPPGNVGSMDPDGLTNISQDTHVPFQRPSFTGSSSMIPRVAGDEKWLAGLGVNGIHGVVNALAVDPAGNVYVGGEFSVAGNLMVHNIAKWNGTSWSSPGYGVNGEVKALLWDASRSWLVVGGEFTAICVNADCSSTTPASAIARWNPAAGGSWETFKGLYGYVHALALDDAGTLYAGGAFSKACANASCSSLGLDVNNVARWDNSGDWLPLGTGTAVGVTGGAVHALVWWYQPLVDKNFLVAGGYFTAAGGNPVNSLALWNPGSNTWGSFWSGVDGNVYALAVDPTTNWIVVGGTFQNICQIGAVPPDCGTKTRVNRIALYDGWFYWGGLGGGFLVYGTYDPGVKSISIDPVKKNIYVAGDNSAYCADTTCASWTDVWFIARWDYNGSGAWSGLGSGLGGPRYYTAARAVAWNSAADTLYVGGVFGFAGGASAERIAKWNGSSWSSLESGGAPGPSIYAATADSHDRVYIGGDFWGVGNVVMNRVAVWNNKTRTWARLGYGVDNSVSAFALDASGNLYVGGDFGYTCANPNCSPGTRANHIARWTPSGESGSWTTLGYGLWGIVYALSLDHHGHLYAGGGSLSICGDETCTPGARTAAKNLVVWDGAHWSPVNLGPNDIIFSMAVDSKDNLYVGGYFNFLCGDVPCTVNGQQVNHIAKWTPAPGGGGNWSSVENGVNFSIHGLTVDKNDVLYAAGEFTYICATPSCTANTRRVNKIATWNGSTWSTLGNGFWYSVNSIVLDELGRPYVGGSQYLCPDEACSTVGTNVNNIAKWDGVSWMPLGSGIGTERNPSVWALTYAQGILSVAGDFDTAGGRVSVNLAQYQASSTLNLPLIRR